MSNAAAPLAFQRRETTPGASGAAPFSKGNFSQLQTLVIPSFP